MDSSAAPAEVSESTLMAQKVPASSINRNDSEYLVTTSVTLVASVRTMTLSSVVSSNSDSNLSPWCCNDMMDLMKCSSCADIFPDDNPGGGSKVWKSARKYRDESTDGMLVVREVREI